ncbi:hypothetical protein SAMCFNEI73_pC0364 (plasmid) [Sinorhizobium americanum]|uniref:Uncharacterized protein n=1 Tax=Sinorhizobium americanum TaxID=194963 RepID=A0A1L3LVL6_9HYPH|nr:hypothetical protein SAMCFNEI73_pC0364 [Sinorhizobium americanum]
MRSSARAQILDLQDGQRHDLGGGVILALLVIALVIASCSTNSSLPRPEHAPHFRKRRTGSRNSPKGSKLSSS